MNPNIKYEDHSKDFLMNLASSMPDEIDNAVKVLEALKSAVAEGDSDKIGFIAENYTKKLREVYEDMAVLSEYYKQFKSFNM